MPCRLREAWHFTLPEAVTLKRFLAPLLVFNLGIWLPFLGPRRGSPNGSGQRELSDSGKHASRHGMPRRAAPLDGPYRVDLSRIARPARAEATNAERAPSPSAGLRASAPIRPWRWSRCPA